MSTIPTNVFGLLTDFGFDYAVASMKGVIAKTFPSAQIIDIDHSLKKFAIISAAFIIDKTACYFPDNMIFICVVDPGVGSTRDMLCVRHGSQWFVGPDNGIFHYLFCQPGVEIYRIKKDYFISRSRTFHGRDVFTPVAIQLAQGQEDFLEHIDSEKVVTIPLLQNHTVVTYIDSFGNIKTNISITSEPLPGTALTVFINGVVYTIPWQTVFVDVPQGTPLCYKGSNDTLEIAVNNGSAQQYFNVDVGTLVTVSF